jgi:hypothetical protein
VLLPKNTVSNLLLNRGSACSDYQDWTLRGLSCQRIQVDEIWSFVGCKKANVQPEHNPDFGDAWTFVAIDADTKLVPSWFVGQHTADDAYAILSDLRGRLASRMQLSTDGHQMYLSATADTFGPDQDYAMVVKEFRSQPKPESAKYSPSRCKSVTIKKVSGSRDPRPHLHALRGAAEPHHPDEHEAVHPPDECVLTEAGEPDRRRLPALHVLQLRPAAPDAHQARGRDQDHARDGRRGCRSHLVTD